MTSAIFNYFGFGGKATTQDDEKSSIRALPASWYTSEEMYELERRAIFSRKWILITHKIRLKQPGDWLKYDVAGFQFILCRDRDGSINGFHNICRHRAYPVVDGDKGTARIFACKYHGWSYGLNGKLAKAPGYQELEDFDKSKNGLLPIHTHIDCNGFVWVNLDGKPVPESTWDDEHYGIDKQDRYEGFNFDEYEFDHEWEMEGDYNWKILADNYNECYHCPSTHPDLVAVADLHSYDVDVGNGHILHKVDTKPEQAAQGIRVCPTYYFPTTSMNISPHFIMLQRFVPHGPTKSVMRYEVYKNIHSSREEFDQINQMYKRVMGEDKVLCERSQKNLSAGIFVNGEMHPRLERGPLYFQSLCREIVMNFHKREQQQKQKIYPARQILPATANPAQAKVSQADVDFCSSLSCQTPQEQLAW